MVSISPRLSLVALLASSAIACSGGGGGGNGPDAGGSDLFDAGPRPDSGPQPDAAGNTCGAVDNFQDLGTIDGEVLAAEGYLSIDGILDEGPPLDLLVVELFQGAAPFETAIANGTYEIGGTQTNYNTCGVCVTVFADIDQDGQADMIYLAQSGTVTVTSVEGNFTGSYAPAGNTASFVGFRFNEGSQEFEEDQSCVITGGGASWDKAIPATP